MELQCSSVRVIAVKEPAPSRAGAYKATRLPRLHIQVLWLRERPMDFEEYDFIRNPVVQNGVLSLESKMCFLWFFNPGAVS